MDEIEKLYSVVKERGLYTKSLDEFKNKYSNSENFNKLYNVVSQEKLYTKSFDEFKQKYKFETQPPKKPQAEVGGGLKSTSASTPSPSYSAQPKPKYKFNLQEAQDKINPSAIKPEVAKVIAPTVKKEVAVAPPIKEYLPLALKIDSDLRNEKQKLESNFLRTKEEENKLQQINSQIEGIKEYYYPTKSVKKKSEEELLEVQQRLTYLEDRAKAIGDVNLSKLNERDGTYLDLKNKQQTLQSKIEEENKLLQKLTSDETITDQFKKSFTPYFLRGYVSPENETINLDEEIKEKLLLSLDRNKKLKSQVSYGGEYRTMVSLDKKEELIKNAKAEVYKEKNSEINSQLEEINKQLKNTKPEDLVTINKLEKQWKDLESKRNELDFKYGYDKVNQQFNDIFKRTTKSKEYDEALKDYPVFDVVSTFTEGIIKTALDATVGFTGAVMSTGDILTEDKEYSIFDALGDTAHELSNNNLLPSSKSKEGALVDEEGNWNITPYSISKSAAQGLPFTLALLAQARTGNVRGVHDKVAKVFRPEKYKDLSTAFQMAENAFKLTLSDNLKEAKESGLDGIKAQAFAYGASAGTGISQLIMPDVKFFNTPSGSAILNTFKGDLSRAVNKKAVESAMKSFVNNLTLEIGEEEVDGAISEVLKMGLLQNYSSEFLSTKTQKEIIGNTLVTTGILGSAGLKSNINANKTKLYKDIDKEYDGLMEQIEIMQKNSNDNKFKEILQESKNKIADVKEAIGKAPENVTGEQIDLLIEKKKVINEMKSVDDSFHGKYKEKINSINKKIEELDKVATEQLKKVQELDKELNPEKKLDGYLRDMETLNDEIGKSSGVEKENLLKQKEELQKNIDEISKQTKEGVVDETVKTFDETKEDDLSFIDELETTEPQEEITKQEFDNFIDNGQVSDARLNDIAEKIKTNKELSEQETLMFNDKTNEVNKILKQKQKNETENLQSNQEPRQATDEKGTENEVVQQGGGVELQQQEEVVTKTQQDAIQKQTTDEGLLRTEQPQMGLQEVEQGNQETTPQQVEEEIEIDLGKSNVYTVKKGQNNTISVVNKNGETPSKATEKKVLLKYLDSIDLTKFKDSYEVEPDAFEGIGTDEEYYNRATDLSTSPSELASIALQTNTKDFPERNLPPIELEVVEYLMSNVKRGSKKTKGSDGSFVNYSDENRIGFSLAKTYLRKDGRGLDVLAKELTEITGNELTPEDLVDYMEMYPNGLSDVKKLSKSYTYDARQKFTQITGLPATDSILNKVIDKKIEQENLKEQESYNILNYTTDQDLLEHFNLAQQYEEQTNTRGEEESNLPNTESGKKQPEIQRGTTQEVGDEEVRFQKSESEYAEVVDGFYSPLEKVISQAKQDKLPVKQWIEKFARGEEAKWTGLAEWLSQQQGSISKVDIQQYLKDNRVEIVEVVKEAKEGYFYKNDEGYERWRELDDTKFSQYQLEGEKENYKEVLVTMPEQRGRGFMVRYKGSPSGEFETRKEAEIYIEDRAGKYPVEKAKYQIEPKTFSKDKAFKSSHFDEPNILVHLRMNTRTDADGNKVLFLEEVQSDWGQQGKKNGFSETEQEYKKRVDDEIKKQEEVVRKETIIQNELMGSEKENHFNNVLQEERSKLRTLKVNGLPRKQSIPTAPFVTDTNAWTKLGLKVALKEALKQGADKIAWTTGEQQNDRYDLSKTASSITHLDRGNGTYKIEVFEKGTSKTLWQKDDATLKEIEDTVGKDIANKIKDGEGNFETDLKGVKISETKVLKGDDLKVGGKGMKGFYGSPTEGRLGIVGNVAKSLFKQEPKTTTINGNKQPSITITPKLKAQVETGLPLFKKNNQDQKPFETKNTTKATKENLQQKFPDAIVVQSESELPQPIQKGIKQQKADGTIKGVYYNGEVYMVADNIKTLGEAEGTYRHERLGHKGVIDYLGDKLSNYAKNVVDKAKGGQLERLKTLAKKYNLPTDFTKLTDKQKQLLGEEYIAFVSENKSKLPNWWNEIAAVVRKALRDLGIDLKISDSEIQALIGKVEKNIKKDLTSASEDIKFAKKEQNDRRTKRKSTLQDLVGEQPEGQKVYRTIEQARQIYGGDTRVAEKDRRGGWNKKRFLGELERIAKENGAWIDDITPLKGKGLKGGQESEVYVSKDKKDVIKVNNLALLDPDDSGLYTRDFDNFIDRLTSHNDIFDHVDYEIIGFTKNSKGEVSVVLKQPHIKDAKYADLKQIYTYLRDNGFKPERLANGIQGFTNGNYEVSDVKPENVLVDKNGVLYFIDADVNSYEEDVMEDEDFMFQKADKELEKIPTDLKRSIINKMKSDRDEGKSKSEILKQAENTLKESDWYNSLTNNQKKEITEKGIVEFIKSGGVSKEIESEDDADYTPEQAVEDSYKMYESFEEQLNKNREGLKNKVVRSFKNLSDKFIDRQDFVKTLLKKTNMDNVVTFMVNRAGASSLANFKAREAYSKTYEGLSNTDRKIFEILLTHRRTIAIAENLEKRGKEQIKRAGGFTEDKAKKAMDGFKNILGNEKYKDLIKRADAYYETQANILDEMHKEGLINDEFYETFKNTDYKQTQYLDFLEDMDGSFVESEADKDNNYPLSGDIIKSFKSGYEGNELMDGQGILEKTLLTRTKAVFQNRVNREFVKEFLKTKEEIKELLTKKDLTKAEKKKIENFNNIEKFVKVESEGKKADDIKGYKSLYYYEKGEKKRVLLKDDFFDKFTDTNNKILSSSAKEITALATGTSTVKSFATGNNPLFFLTNTPRDFAFVLAFSEEYGSNISISDFKTPKGALDAIYKAFTKGNVLFNSAKLTADMFKGITSVAKKDTNFKLYLENGGGMDYLALQGKYRNKGFTKTMMDYMFSQKVQDKINNNKVKRFLDTFNLASEMGIRLAVFNTSVKNQLNGRDINKLDKSEKDLIYAKAVESARQLTDFNQGGTVTKALDAAIPYLNAAVQGTRSAGRSLKERPISTISRITQVTAYSVGSVITASLGAISFFRDDEDEETKNLTNNEIYFETLDGVSDYDLENYFIIPLGTKDKDKNDWKYLRIAKAQFLTPIINLIEHFIRRNIAEQSDIKYQGDANKIAFNSFKHNILPLDVTEGKTIIARIPAVSAAFAAYGYSSFTGKPLTWEHGKIEPEFEGLYDDVTEPMFKAIGEKIEYSPLRMQKIVESFVTTPSTNPYIGISYGIGNLTTSLLTQDEEGIILPDMNKTILEASIKRLIKTSSDFNRKMKHEERMSDEAKKIKKEHIKLENEIKNKLGEIGTNREERNKFLKEMVEKYPQHKLMIKSWDASFIRKVKQDIKGGGAIRDLDYMVGMLKYERNPELKASYLVDKFGSDLLDVKSMDKDGDDYKLAKQLYMNGILDDKTMYYYKYLVEGEKFKE